MSVDGEPVVLEPVSDPPRLARIWRELGDDEDLVDVVDPLHLRTT